MFWNLFDWLRGDDDGRQEVAKKKPLPRIGVNADHAGPDGAELDRLMLAVAAHQQANPEEICYEVMVPLYIALVDAMILVPTSGPIDEIEAENSRVFRLATLKNPHGDRGIPVFTTEDALERWVDEPTEYVGLPFRILCEKVLESGMNFMVINPSGPARGELCLYELSYLAKGMIPPRSDRQTEPVYYHSSAEIVVSIPDDPPPQMLIERVTGCFRQNPMVESAYVFQVSMAEGPPHLAMGVRVFEGEEQRWETDLLPNTIAIFHEVLDQDEFIDFFLLNDSDELEASLREVTEPFFTNQQAS